MTREKNILLRIGEDDKIRFEEFSKDHNRSVSQFLRDAAGIVMRNPTLLDPTGETAKLIFDLDRFETSIQRKDQSILEVFKAFSNDIDVLKIQMEEIMKNIGIPKEKIKKLKQKQKLGSLVRNGES